MISISSHRQVYGDLTLLDRMDPEEWERAYQATMDPKYKKGGRNYSTKIHGKKWTGEGGPPIFLIPRERGGPSYKQINLEGCESTDLQFCPISKGFGMQDVSSFTLGPVIGEGLCVVNASFSKVIAVHHIEGGGVLNLTRKNLWKRTSKPCLLY